jgi:hypothetical protein
LLIDSETPGLEVLDQIEEMMELGFKLRCWHDLFESDVHWNKWRRRYLGWIPNDLINLCIRIWDKNELYKRICAEEIFLLTLGTRLSIGT